MLSGVCLLLARHVQWSKCTVDDCRIWTCLNLWHDNMTDCLFLTDLINEEEWFLSTDVVNTVLCSWTHRLWIVGQKMMELWSLCLSYNYEGWESHNITQLMNCIQLLWFQIQSEALGFRHLKSLFLNPLENSWTQLISWGIVWYCMPPEKTHEWLHAIK